MRLGLPELIVILVIIVVLFGAKLLPKLAKSGIETYKDTKKELKEMAKAEALPEKKEDVAIEAEGRIVETESADAK